MRGSVGMTVDSAVDILGLLTPCLCVKEAWMDSYQDCALRLTMLQGPRGYLVKLSTRRGKT